MKIKASAEYLFTGLTERENLTLARDGAMGNETFYWDGLIIRRRLNTGDLLNTSEMGSQAG